MQVNQQLIRILEGKQGAPVDLDNATLRVTLDVIGRVGFGKDFGATHDLSDGKANFAFDMMAAGERMCGKSCVLFIMVFVEAQDSNCTCQQVCPQQVLEQADHHCPSLSALRLSVVMLTTQGGMKASSALTILSASTCTFCR